MKVTIVCDVLGKKNNGTTLAAYNLIDYLKSKGHDVVVVCSDEDKIGKEGFDVVPVMDLGPLNAVLKANGVSLAKADKKILEKAMEGSDVVHVMMPFSLGSMAAKIAKKKGIPVTAGFHAQAENVTSHIFCMNLPLANHITYQAFYHFLYKNVTAIHYPTQFIKDLFEKEIGREIPCRVISNGVNDSFYVDATAIQKSRVSEKFTILCMGRFSKEKSQQTLINAIAKSALKDKIKLVFAGNGPKESYLKRLARRKGVDADFRFYTREELLSVMHAADLYVHTAVVEIEAIACLEAIVSGLVPIICDSPRSATKNFAIDENCLYKASDSDELVKKIEYFYHNREILQAYHKKYVSFKNDFEQKKCMEQMERMLFDYSLCNKEHFYA